MLVEKLPRWLAGWLERNFHIAFRGKSVGCLGGWLPGWLAGGVLSCVCMVNHFERVFTWLSDANWCFSFALARRLADYAGWQTGQRWLAGWLSWLCEVHFGWVFMRLSDANLLTVCLAGCLAGAVLRCVCMAVPF